MHLHVDRNGRMRSPQDRAKAVRAILGLARQLPTGNLALVKGIQGLAKGLKSHSHRALQALFKTLDSLIKDPRPGKLLIIQSGDLEAYGAMRASSSTWFSPAFEYWTTAVARFSQADECVNIYGNHDVWPGTLPFFDPQSTGDVEQYLQSIYFPGTLPNPLVMNASPCTLEIYRLNTVQAQFLKNTLASGNIDTNVLLPSTHSPSTGQSTVRLLVMHHPPHFFNASGGISDLFEGRLTNAIDRLPF